jgi:hypothetical protein
MKHQKILTVLILILVSCAFLGFASMQDKDGDKTASFNVEKGGKLEMKVAYGDITITPWDKNEVYIRAIGFDEDEIEKIKMKGDKNKVTIRFKIDEHESGSSSGEFMVNVPKEFNLGLSTGGGTISIEDDIKGSVDGSTGGGNIKLRNVVNGKVSLSTGGGNVKAGAIGGDVDLSTGGGDIDINDIKGHVRSSTGGGNITLGKANGDAQISTGGGNINLSGADGDVTASTGGGNVNVRIASGKVSVSTGGGSVDLKDITGRIVASTGGGEITAELKPSGKGDSKLSTGGGDIKLYVASDAKATIDATISITKKWSKNSKKYKIISDFKADSYEEDEQEEEIRGVYQINGGGERITLSTSNSNISILKK